MLQSVPPLSLFQYYYLKHRSSIVHPFFHISRISSQIRACFAMESSFAFTSLKGATPFAIQVQTPSVPFLTDATGKSLYLKRTLFTLKAVETMSILTSDASKGVALEKKDKKSTFPNGFEALILGICDETDVAELKLKVGKFEMHLKRDIGSPASSTLIAPSVAPPAPPPPPPASSKTKVEATSVPTQATPQKSSPFSNDSSSKASKLAALETSGSNTYLLVSSPTVGTFRSGRTLKGKKQPPSCKEGDVIKEGQTIGFLDQFGSELPVKSSVAGEVLKILCKDGEPVGFGDPLVAVLPSFHGIK